MKLVNNDKIVQNDWLFVKLYFSVMNPFLVNVSILYPLKKLENLWFSGVFKGYKIGTLVRNGLLLSKIIVTRFWLI